MRIRLLLASTLAAATAPAHAAVTISPLPGTPDASPKTQISVWGISPARIVAVRATGSESGAHAGRLAPYSRGRGASFLPAAPFAEGERVAVTVTLRGERSRRSSFVVARAGATPPVINLGVEQPDKLEHFASAPELRAPKISVLTPGDRAAPGSLFLTPLPSPVVHPGSDNSITISPVGPGGPMIVDGQGRLVWFRPLEHPDVAANLRVQRFHGKRVLTWWQGPVTIAAFGLGQGIIADDSYRTVRTVKAGNGYMMDIHELTLTPDGTALFPVYVPVRVHLPGTPAGTLTSLLDAIVQEVDVDTGLVVWEWHSLGHVPVSDSYATPGNSAYYDVFHINAIQSLPGRRILVSMRDTSALYHVDQARGRVLWTLGGRSSDFRLGPGARFWFQHDAQLLPGGRRVSLFDDQAGPPQKAPSSRALFLDLDMQRHRATVARELQRAEDTSAQSEGAVQSLPNGNVLAGFGAQPFFTEWDHAGRIVFDARLPVDDGSYRVYRFPWHAKPTGQPAVAVTRTGPSSVTVHASFNGATEVARWRVLAGTDPSVLSPVATTARDGFETAIDVSGAGTVFAVRALDRAGRALGTSPAVSAP